jgi:PKD domain
MKITKTTLLFIATLFFLAMPLMFTSGNASAAQFVHNDGATHNANGGYQLPAGQCTGVATFLTTGTQSASTLAGVTTDVACQAQLNTVAVAAGLSGASAITQTLCANNGLSWSTRHLNCSNTWDTINPDTGVLYGSDASISGNQGCLRCHNTDYMTAGGHDLLAAKERYLLTGHRNMLRKVTTPYAQWLNGDTAVSTPAGTLPVGSAISLGGVDWTSSNSTVPGFPTVSGATPYSLPAGTLYEWGGWWGNKKIGQILREPAVPDSPSTVKAGGSYACGQCHTTGWDVAGASSAPAQTDQPPAGLINTAGATWIYEGVQCSRCHDYPATATVDAPVTTGVYNSSHNNGVLAENEASTQLCFQCHTQESAVNAADESQLVIGGHSGYAAAFAGHFRTNQFLNSPHARFTGTEGQVGNGANYESKWQAGTCSDSFLTNKTDCTTAGDTWTSLPNDNNGCVTCHDVHTSSVDPDVMDPTSTMSNIKAGGTCGTSCHSYINLGKINHPIAPNTPLDGDLSTPKGKMMACTTCHMTGQSASKLSHLWRIEPSADYSTFPTAAQYAAGQQTANTEPDGAYTNAVYMDVDLVCGQCHGGGTSSTSPAFTKKAEAPYFSKATLSTLAENMHNTYPTAKFAWTNDSSTSYAVNFNAISSTCPSGVTSCTYSWDFGDTNTGTGVATSHTYTSGSPVTVTLTVSTPAYTTDVATQVVTPTAVHQFPTCGAVALTPAQVGDLVTFTDSSTIPATNGGSAAVYVNWGDGSQLSVGAVGGSVTHNYNNAGNYMVTQIVQDNLGYNCTAKYALPISKAGVTAGSGNLEIDTNATFAVSYYIKGLNAFNVLVTKASGSMASGGNVTVPMVPGDYQVYLYFANGHTCTWTQGQAATVTNASTTTVSATGCN